MLKSWKDGTGGSMQDPEDPAGHDLNSSSVNGVTATERYFGNGAAGSTWNTFGIGADDIDAAKNSLDIVGKQYNDKTDWNFSVTTAVMDWLTSPSTNFGLLLKNENPANKLGNTYSFPSFYSADSHIAAQTQRPKLTIIFKN